MISRTRLIITALLGCHLLLAPALLTSQLRSNPGGQESPAISPTSDNSPTQEPNSSGTTQGNSSSTTTQQPAPPKTQTPPQEDEGMRVMQEVVQQQMRDSAQRDSGPPRPPANVVLNRDEVLIRADEQEKSQDIYKVRGNVEIRFRNNVIHCDQATYDSSTGIVVATGHVVYDGGTHSEHLVGTHATYDISRDTGTFYDVTGSTGITVKNPVMYLRSSTPFFFTGKVVDKLGPDLYRVHNGIITSCRLPKPKWEYHPATAVVEVGGEAKMYHATMRIAGIPVFYFPYGQHPADNLGRQSGFLIPAIGQSNSKGTIIGDSFYWAINRNSDAEIGGYLFSARGYAQVGDYRNIGWHYQLHAEYYGVIDEKGNPTTKQRQGGEEIRVNGSADLPDGFRGVISVDYLSSYLFRLAFAQSFTQAINSEVRSVGFVSKSWSADFMGLMASRYQNYQSEVQGDVIDIAHIPSFQMAGFESPILGSAFMYTYDFAAEGLSRHEPGFQTQNIVGRVDGSPTISLPKFLKGWTFRPEAGFRETVWTERLVPTENNTGVIGVALAQAINRNVFQGSMEVRPPSIERIFDRKLFGYVMKHVVEPYAVYRYETGIDNFANIIRFDERDILADSNGVEYGVINRLYAKKSKSSGECYQHPKYLPPDTPAPKAKELMAKDPNICDDQSGPAREVITWTIAQKYFFNPTFGGALVPNQRNVFDSSVDFSGIAFLTEPRNASPIISRLLVNDKSTSYEWALDYDPVLHQINASTIFVGQRLFRKVYLIGAEIYQHIPGEVIPSSNNEVLAPDISNQVRAEVIYGNVSNPGFSAAASLAYDIRNVYVQGATVQSTYNWDCCGISFEYSRWALGPVRNENAYRFAFSLTNVGTFGNLKRLQRIY
ncbi:MAG: LPS assembly protein LptD [Candidatus Korobacteraceae bacterium]